MLTAGSEHSLRPVYHFTTPDKWKNDPQRPIYLDGKYHYYYLYNRDYPKGNGTEWRHATSLDLVHWKDEGVAIPKYTTKNGDPWSGSVVLDESGSAGFGKGALVAVVTQPSANGKQEQYLWYSTDRGRTFKIYGDRPVLANPGTKDFRDPKVIWDARSQKWVMALAEGTKIGFYESANLKKWSYTGSFQTHHIGLVECPDLYRMRADDGTDKWVLGVSANGLSSGKPNTYAYWTGDFNSQEFIPDQREPEWLDYGFDWYAAVSFEDGTSGDKLDHRYALAWMNNWNYAHSTPTLKEGFNGMDSIVREIKLRRSAAGSYSLVSSPIDALKESVVSENTFEPIHVNGSYPLQTSGFSYQLDADISWTQLKNVGLRVRESTDGSRHADVGVFTAGGYAYVNRTFTGHPDKDRRYVESQAPFRPEANKVHLKVLVDKTSIEVFVDDGYVVLSNVIYPEWNDLGITLYTEGGSATFSNLVIKHFAKP
ncbi:glycoside hydrolase family 32 protein [Paenibacillus sp. CAA11]|uniref:glycoside hydrolase family 32 protein n=1 Tax=Paenibacillus sp. CAA11 TaxID=1532905 RepID=UPI001F27E31D|nr:glycoside hydrolase family 32 protein [Paenibacillus sp. CAA11]